MRWIDEPTRGSLADTVVRQIAVLREQMSESVEPPGANREAVSRDDEE